MEIYGLAAGIAFLLLGLLVLAWNFPDRINRAFGLALFLAALVRLTVLVPDEPGALRGLRMLSGYAGVAGPFAFLYVAAAYHDRYARPGLRRVALPILLAAGLAAEAAYLMDHRSIALGRPLGFGLYWLSVFGPSLMAALLADDAAKAPERGRRRSLALASLGFGFLPTAYVLHLWIPDLMDVIRGITPLQSALMLLTLGPIGFVVLRLASLSQRAGDPILRHDVRLYLGVLALAPATVGALLAIRLAASFEVARTAMIFIMIGWTLLGDAVVAYAILHHQVFGAERRLKVTLERGTVVGAFVAVFVVVAQFLEAYLQGFSWVLGGVCAALLVFAMKPLSRLASRVADAAMPGVDDTPVYAAYRRLQVYESALAAAWEDGEIRAEERVRLDRLRDRLRLPTPDATAIERDFRSAMTRTRRASAVPDEVT